MIRQINFMGMTWHWISREYDDDQLSIEDFQALHAEGQRRNGKLDIGTYRHFASGTQLITVLSHKQYGVRVADKLLRGQDHLLADVHLRALILRRAQVLAELIEAKAPSGAYKVEHDRPTPMNPDGTMEDDVS